MQSRDTMKFYWFVLLLVIGVTICVPAATATFVEEKDGYIVTPGDITNRQPEISRFSSSSISQGQMHWYSTFIPTGKTSLYIDLYWGVPSNSLALTILAPDATFGPYYDSADGQIDGRINLRISRPSGLASGTWGSSIYGYHVVGEQGYTYTVSAN
ncbi:MAG TPA: peptidase domain-containing protein [Methanoregulaceae archaeon]|nr:peptidase domain-containing protein [Methanoregulaceae archaeon]